MIQNRPALFRGRHFEDVIIMLCVRWYLRYSLSYRDLEEMMAERQLSVDHVTIWRWVQHYAPILNERLRRERRRPNGSWRVDETYVRVAGTWAYLYRAIDSTGDTIDFMLSPKRDLTAAKLFLRLALSGTGGIRPRVVNVDGHPAYARAIQELKHSGDLGRRRQCQPVPYLNNILEQDHPVHQKAHRCEGLWISVGGRGYANDRRIRGNAPDPERPDPEKWLPKGDAIGNSGSFIPSLASRHNSR